MDQIVDTIQDVLNHFVKEHGRMPENWDELNLIGEQAKMLDDLGPISTKDSDELDWMEA